MKLPKILSKNTVLLPLIGLLALGVGFVGTSVLSEKSYPKGTGCTGICVALTPQGMEPNELAVKTGDYVQFNSADGKKHNISLGEGAGGTEDPDHSPHAGKHEHRASLSSGDFAADEAWRIQFKEPGTFELHDHYNPDLNILIIVYEDSKK